MADLPSSPLPTLTGRYELYCSLPGDPMAGMHVQITARPG